MANTIQISLSTYNIDFAGGQGFPGARVPPYVEYATDIDTNFVTLRNTINTVIQEVKAVQGPNATLGTEALFFNDPNRSPAPLLDGRIGRHSYLTTIGVPPDRLEVEPGSAMVNQEKVTNTSPATHINTGAGAGTYWVALDSNGITMLENLVGLQQLDLYSAVWNGTAFTSITQLAEIQFDGDEYEGMRTRPVETPTWTAVKYDQFNHRMRAVERLLAGLATDDQGAAIGPLVMPDGSAGSPGLTFRGIQTLGWYRSGNNLNASTSGTLRLTISSAGILNNVMGSLGAPSYSFVGDAVTGMYRIAANRLGFQTNSLLGLEISASQQPTSPTAFRVRVTTAAEALASSATPSAISMDTEVTDVGSWGAAPTATWTVPAGGDGFYTLTGHCFFDESTSATPNVGEVRRTQLVANSVVVADELDEPHSTASEDIAQSVAALVQLTAGQTIHLHAAQDSGNSMDVNGHLAACRLW